jgi:hypothetical protein
MSIPSPSARSYRRLGYLALAHAGALVALTAFVLQNSDLAWLRHLWVGLFTLWFFWPVVLVLHPGRSALRLAVFALVSAVLLFPSLRWYDLFAAEALGFPDGVGANPLSAWLYFSAYRAGRAEAQKDVAAGILAIEEYGFGAGAGLAAGILRERYQIEIRATAGCMVDEKIIGHAAGYNKVSEAEIDRRVGRDRVDAAREEGARLGAEQHERVERYSKDLAKRLSGFPSDSKITLETLHLWTDGEIEIGTEAEQDLVQSVRAVERFIAEIIPPDAPGFELHVSGRLTPTESPIFEAPSASLSCPRPVYDKIYKDLPSLPLPQWNRVKLSMSLNYAVRETH